ncbi:CHAP domain-containing protein, partial [Candidatus Berkelbacteria bacterium]|nr:CHAP domain-containing protein [Candidatus Berkelbacteria bacterium]
YSSGGYTNLGKMYGTYNGGLPGWCTWYVNYRRPDLPNGMGNARDYLNSARSRGIPTGSTPRVGAVMVTRESYYGHIAYVSAVGANSFTVMEMNYVGRYIVSSRSVPNNFWALRGFVYKK